MTFKNPAMNFIQIAATIAQLQQLCTLLDPDNGNARWNLVQDWLKSNPDKKEMTEKAASLPAGEALVYLLDQINLDASLLKRYDPMGQVTRQAEVAIAELQKLYNERKQFDASDGRQIGSRGKKQKEKSMKNAFEAMNRIDLEIIK